MKILLLGENGQLGSTIKKRFKIPCNIESLSKNDIDLTKTDKIINKIQSYNPDIIINAAAYTNVDQAEKDYKNAYLINSKANEKIAQYSFSNKSLFIYYSTDYVFDGRKNNSYIETDLVNPLNIYGKSKLMGENAIIESKCNYIIFRTSWVYSNEGKNFPNKILDLASKKDNLQVVEDEIGSPTSTELISDITETCIEKNYINSLYHITSEGKTTRLDFAKYLIEGVNKRGKKLKCKIENIEPLLPESVRSKVIRPKNSLLNCNKIKSKCGINIPAWQFHADLFLDKYSGV